MEMDNEQQLDETVHSLSDLLESGQDEEFINAFDNLHDFEMGKVYAALPARVREVAWRTMDDETLASIFDNLEIEDSDVVDLLSELPPKKGADILERMYADNEADLLQAMPARMVATYLQLLPAEDAQEMRKLIKYDDQTAGALMATEYLAVQKGMRVAEVLEKVKEQASEAESIIYIYVIDADQRLIGVASLRDLLTHPDEMLIDEITNTRVVSVGAEDPQGDVAQVVADYNFFSIPVIDKEQHLLGIITVDDIVDVIDEEAVGEYSGLAAVDVSQTDDTPWHSAIKRIPWLLVLLILGLTTTALVGSFEGSIRQAPVLAAFITLITGTAGNAGTQSLALSIRRLSVGNDKSIAKNFFSELLSAAILALAAGITIGLVVLLWRQNNDLAAAIGLSMAAAIFLASLLSAIIPVIIDKLGYDPAVANGPFITTLCDLTSVGIYFIIAQQFLTYFVGS